MPTHALTPTTPHLFLSQEYDKYDELHSQFWDALYVIAETEVAEARRRDESDRAALRANRGLTDGSGTSTLAPHERGLHPDVEEDIEAMMQGERMLRVDY